MLEFRIVKTFSVNSDLQTLRCIIILRLYSYLYKNEYEDETKSIVRKKNAYKD